MTPEEAAARLGLPVHEVTDVREHLAGHVVTVVGGGELLVTATVVRRYLPEVDDEPVRVTEPDASAADAEPAPKGARPAQRRSR